MIVTRAVEWCTPEYSLRRLAIVRATLSLFMVLDVLVILPNPWALTAHPDFYAPVFALQILHLPPLTLPFAVLLFVGVAGGASLVAWTSLRPEPGAQWARVQKTAGIIASVAFSLWVFYAMSYGYIQHDHLALMIAAWVLPTAPAAHRHSVGTSRAGGWALRAIQLAVVATYFFSVLGKWVYSGTPFAWANSAVFARAFIRRGSIFVRWMLDLPWLFVPAQWTLLAVEILSPLVFLVKGRGLYVVAGFFALFHFATFMALGIHFLPTVVCWVAFLPLCEDRPKAGGIAGDSA